MISKNREKRVLIIERRVMNKLSKTQTICYLGLGVALYFVLGSFVKLNLIGHIQIDLGYIAFGVYLVIFGIQGTVVGVIGCLLESMVYSGWFPAGWILGQLFVGLFCGITFKAARGKYKRYAYIGLTSIAVFVGIAVIKTITECFLYQIPFAVKIPKNAVAFVADAIPMILGVVLGDWILNIGKGKQK